MADPSLNLPNDPTAENYRAPQSTYRGAPKATPRRGPGLAVIVTLIVVVGLAVGVLVGYGLGSGQLGPRDSGRDVCKALVATWEATSQPASSTTEDLRVQPQTISDLKGSREPHLRAAGAALERANRDKGVAQLPDVLTAIAQAAAGCQAVGVPLPPEMLVVAN